MKLRHMLFSLFALASAACGVSNGKTLSDLDASEREAICKDVPKEQALCEFDDYTRGKAECEIILSSVNSVCPVTVREFREALDAPICSMLEKVNDWESSCFGEPEDPIVVTNNANQKVNNSSVLENNCDNLIPAISGCGVNVSVDCDSDLLSCMPISDSGDCWGRDVWGQLESCGEYDPAAQGFEITGANPDFVDIGILLHQFDAQIDTPERIAGFTNLTLELDGGAVLETGELCLTSELVDVGRSAEFEIELRTEDGEKSEITFGQCPAVIVGNVEYRQYDSIQFTLEGVFGDGRPFRDSINVNF